MPKRGIWDSLCQVSPFFGWCGLFLCFSFILFCFILPLKGKLHLHGHKTGTSFSEDSCKAQVVKCFLTCTDQKC